MFRGFFRAIGEVVREIVEGVVEDVVDLANDIREFVSGTGTTDNKDAAQETADVAESEIIEQVELGVSDITNDATYIEDVVSDELADLRERIAADWQERVSEWEEIERESANDDDAANLRAEVALSHDQPPGDLIHVALTADDVEAYMQPIGATHLFEVWKDPQTGLYEIYKTGSSP